jgi:hypothetical protein
LKKQVFFFVLTLLLLFVISICTASGADESSNFIDLSLIFSNYDYKETKSGATLDSEKGILPGIASLLIINRQTQIYLFEFHQIYL